MANFYDDWLGLWVAEQEERRRAKKAIHEEDLEWVRTRQDNKAALLCARENGFITDGNATLAEIPKGWNTGKHSHGEEAMFIISGKGYSVVDGKRYDWETGSCVFLPYGSIHQHFNTGETEVRYLSAMELALERFAGLANVMHYEDARETPRGEPQGVEKAESSIDPERGRIVLRLEDAPVIAGKDQGARYAKRTDDFTLTLAKEMRTPSNTGHRAINIELMNAPEVGFKAREVEMTHILCDAPGMRSGKHAHMEALIYVLDGEGYSIVDGERFPWKKGTLLHIQGPQTVHQHFNTGQVESRHLRIHYGLRRYFQPIATRVFPYLYYEYGA